MPLVNCFTCKSVIDIPAQTFKVDKPYVCQKQCKTKKFRERLSEWRLDTRGYPSGYSSVDQYHKALLKKVETEKQCVVCGGSFVGVQSKQYCSASCGEKHRIEKIANTKLERYGTRGYNNSKKREETCMKEYGVTNVAKLESTQKKMQDTCMRTYGAKNISQSEEGKRRIGDGIERNHGVRSYFSKREEIVKAFQRKHNVDNPQQIREVNERTAQTRKERYVLSGCVPKKQSQETCMEKYGATAFFGSEQGRMSRDNLINNYGYSPEQVDQIMKSKDSCSFDRYLEKFNGNEELATEAWKHRVQKCDSMSYEWAMSKANGNEEIANEIFLNRQLGIKTKYGNASKASMSVFGPLLEILVSNGYDLSDLYLGADGRQEYFLFDKDHSCVYFYDFTIRSKRIIIEYNGTRFHPKTREEDPDKWDHDQRKKEVAELHGFRVITVWDDILPAANLQIITEEMNR